MKLNLEKIILFAIIAILSVCSGFAGINNNAIVETGNVTYHFKKGIFQCLSEQDANEALFVSLKSLKENTKVKFNKIERRSEDYVLTVLMQVEDKEICASWIDLQEVKLVIDPIQVDQSSLEGKIVYQKDKVTVFVVN